MIHSRNHSFFPSLLGFPRLNLLGSLVLLQVRGRSWVRVKVIFRNRFRIIFRISFRERVKVMIGLL